MLRPKALKEFLEKTYKTLKDIKNILFTKLPLIILNP